MAEQREADSSELESEVTLAKLVQWYEDAEEACREERKNGEQARDYYDGKQWTDDEVAELNKREQPVVTTNRIAPKINFLLGGEIETRVDPKALPRTPKEDSGARAITDALRYVSSREAANFDAIRSLVAGELFIEGLSGGGLLGVRPKPGGGVEITFEHVPFDRYFHDPRARKPLLEDAKYHGVVTWLSVEDAIAKYPGHAETLRNATSRSGGLSSEAHKDRPNNWYDEKGNRVLVAECFWRERGEWWMCHYVRHQVLIAPRLVPFVDEFDRTWCPLRPVSAYVSRSNERYGPVKGMISPQDEINKRRSLALHLLMQRRIIFETGAVLNPTEFQSELAKPDGAAEVQPGALKDSKIQVLNNTELAAGQAQLLAEAKGEIDATGPSAPVIAGDKSTQSGIAILRKKELGNTELRPLFQNIAEWQHGVFLGFWYLIRQYWTAEMWFRVTDDEQKSGYRFVGLNRRMTRGARVQELLGQGVALQDAFDMVGLSPEDMARIVGQAQQGAMSLVAQEAARRGIDPNNIPPEMADLAKQQLDQATQALVFRSPEMQEPFIANHVGEIGVDIILESSPDMAIVQEEQFGMLAEMARGGVFNPQVTPVPVMKMLLEASQLRDKRKLIALLEELSNPQQDPAQQQAAQAQMAMQMQAAQAQLAKLTAEIEQIKAKTAKTVAEIPGVQAATQLDKASAMQKAIEAGHRSIPMVSIPAMAAGSQRRSG